MDSGNSSGKNRYEYFQRIMRRAFSINQRLLTAKLIYFVYGFAVGSLQPFLNIFFVSIGLSTSQAGFITGVRFVASLIAGPLWGALSDYTGRRKLVLTALCLGGSVSMFIMPWVAKAINDPRNMTCVIENSTLYNRSDTLIRDVDCLLPKEESVRTLFYVLLAIMTFGAIFIGPLSGCIDSSVMALIKTGTEKASYGGQVIFAPFGISLASYLSGIAADNYQSPSMSNYTAVFFIFLPSMLLLIPLVCYMIGQIDWGKNITKDTSIEVTKSKNESKGIISQLSLIFRSFDIIVILLTVLIGGAGCAVFMNFTLLFVSDEINTTKANMSLVVVVSMMAEVFVFPITSKLIKVLRGTENAIAIGIFSFFIRFVGMSYADSFLIIVLLQALHGVGFGLTWVAILEHIHKIAPYEIKDTMFQINNSIYFGLSILLANMAGGELYSLYGSRLLFRGAGILCGVWAAAVVVYFNCKHAYHRIHNWSDSNVTKHHFSSNEEFSKVENGNKSLDIGIDNHAKDIKEDITIEIPAINKEEEMNM